MSASGKQSTPDVEAYLDGVADERKRADCRALVELMREATGEAPAMWSSGIVGFGRYHYRYESGREGDWFLAGFAPRSKGLSLYLAPGFDGYGPLLARLGPHDTGKACVYVKRLADVDPDVLRELVARSAEHAASLDASG